MDCFSLSLNFFILGIVFRSMIRSLHEFAPLTFIERAPVSDFICGGLILLTPLLVFMS